MITGNLLIRPSETEKDSILVMGVIESPKPLKMVNNVFYKGVLTQHFGGMPQFQVFTEDDARLKVNQFVVDGSKNADQVLSMPIWKRGRKYLSEHSMRGKILIRKSQLFAGERGERYLFFGLWSAPAISLNDSHMAFSYGGDSLKTLMMKTESLPMQIEGLSTSELFTSPLWGSKTYYALNTDLSLPVFYEYQSAIADVIKTGEWPTVSWQTRLLLSPLMTTPSLLRARKFLSAIGYGPEVYRHLLPNDFIQNMRSYEKYAGALAA